MKSDQMPQQAPEAAERIVMGRLLELAAAIPDAMETDLRAEVVALLATEAMPPAGVYEQKEDGQPVVRLMVPADPGTEHVSVELYDVDSGDGLQVMLPQLEARAMHGAAGVVEKTRGFVADTYDQMLAELDYQVACYRQGRAPEHPDQRLDPDCQILQAGDGTTLRVEMSGGGTVLIPDGQALDVATAARLLGFDDRQTQQLAAIVEHPGTCLHHAMPPANSVAPFEHRNCPTCGARLRSYPASTTTSGEPEWSAIP